MPSSRPNRWMLALACGLLIAAGCSTTTDTPEGNTGALSVDLVIADGIVINQVSWQITGNDMDMSNTIDVSAPGSTASVEVFGLPPGEEDYTVTLTAESADEQVTCRGSADFNVEIGETTDVMVVLNCKLPRRLGAVRVNGEFNICAELIKAVVSPLQTSVGNDIDVSAQAVDQEGDPITFSWTGSGGSFADASASATTYTCEEVGDHEISISVTDNDEYCDMATWTIPVTCVAGDGGTGGTGGAGGETGGAGGEAGSGGAGGEAGAGGAGGEAGAGGQGGAGGAVDPCDGLDCSDGNECTDDFCTDGVCSNPPVTDGEACDNMMGICESGVCAPANLCEGVNCDDGNECTQDICDPATGLCSNPDDDGAACTCPVCGAEGICMMGECTDPCEGIDCSDGNQCTADLCNVGVCSNPNVGPGASCDQDGGAVCDGSGNCVACNEDADCAEGEVCENNECVVGLDCPPAPIGPTVVRNACRNSFNQAVSTFPITLTATPLDCPFAGAPFDVDVDPVIALDLAFLQAAADTLCTLGTALQTADVSIAQVQIDAVAGASCTPALAELPQPLPQTVILDVTVTGTCGAGGEVTVNSPTSLTLPQVTVSCTTDSATGGDVTFCSTGNTPLGNPQSEAAAAVPPNLTLTDPAVGTWLGVNVPAGVNPPPIQVVFSCDSPATVAPTPGTEVGCVFANTTGPSTPTGETCAQAVGTGNFGDTQTGLSWTDPTSGYPISDCNTEGGEPDPPQTCLLFGVNSVPCSGTCGAVPIALPDSECIQFAIESCGSNADCGTGQTCNGSGVCQ